LYQQQIIPLHFVGKRYLVSFLSENLAGLLLQHLYKDKGLQELSKTSVGGI
jgi:hypothetical protein